MAVTRSTNFNISFVLGGLTLLEMLLARLDEQGLQISSSWAADDEEYIVEAFWPRIHKAWLEKERWVGCTEAIDDVRKE